MSLLLPPSVSSSLPLTLLRPWSSQMLVVVRVPFTSLQSAHALNLQPLPSRFHRISRTDRSATAASGRSSPSRHDTKVSVYYLKYSLLLG